MITSLFVSCKIFFNLLSIPFFWLSNLRSTFVILKTLLFPIEIYAVNTSIFNILLIYLYYRRISSSTNTS